MSYPGEYSYREIRTQGESWRSALEGALAQSSALASLFSRNRERQVLFVGCGSTHYLALFAAPYFQRATGCACRGLPSSELWLQPETLLAPGAPPPLVVALSRSGETSETIQAVRALRSRGSDVLTVSCYDDTPLSAASTLTVGVPAGREESFAQTRSFAGMLVAVQAVAAIVSGDQALLAALALLPGLAEELIGRADSLAQRLGPDEALQRITYLGTGPLYGLAGEAMVKMKEMSLSLAEAFHFMEFRHGPMALVDGAHLTVALLGEGAREYERGVLRDLRQRGGHVLGIAEDEAGLGAVCDETFALASGLPARALSVLYLPLLQLLAYHRSRGRGLNPDRPRNVVMAIRLDGAEMSA
jgi:glutamine---fructose-6-phosphate transaminase (isomerizing)